MSPLYSSAAQKSSLKKRNLFDSSSAEKPKTSAQALGPLKKTESEYNDVSVHNEDCTLAEPKLMRNAVSFNDRPMLSKVKSIKPDKKQQDSVPFPTPIKLDLSKCKPANEQDDDFGKSDSSDDYDGMTRYQPPTVAPVTSMDCEEDKMDIDNENDLP